MPDQLSPQLSGDKSYGAGSDLGSVSPFPFAGSNRLAPKAYENPSTIPSSPVMMKPASFSTLATTTAVPERTSYLSLTPYGKAALAQFSGPARETSVETPPTYLHSPPQISPLRSPPVAPTLVTVASELPTELPAEPFTPLYQLQRFPHPPELLSFPADNAPEIINIARDAVTEVQATLAASIAAETSSIRPESSMSGPIPFRTNRLVDPTDDFPEVVGGVGIPRTPTVSYPISLGIVPRSRGPSGASSIMNCTIDTRTSISRLSIVSSSTSASTGSSTARTSDANIAKIQARMAQPVYAVGPAAIAGMVTVIGLPTDRYQGERYVAPKLESPYAKKFRKMRAARKGEGECASCLDDIKNKRLVQLEKCQHKYCAPCFHRLIMTAMGDETHFPPRCCLIDIPTATILSSLPILMRPSYRAKEREFSLPASERWYCPHARCLRWMDLGTRPPRRNAYMATALKCPHCREAVCVICRGPGHGAGADCPQDFGLEATLEIGERNGWRRCYNCRAMVELGSGCRHITCKCRAEFCYVCGARWKTCECTEADKVARDADIARARDQLGAEERETLEAIRLVEEEEERERRDEEVRERIQEYELQAQRRAEEDVLRMVEEARVKEIQRIFAAVGRGIECLQRRQREEMDERHAREMQAAIGRVEETEDELERRLTQESGEAGMRSVVAIQTFERLQKQELDELITGQEEEEDDYFLGIRAHLRGKANREAREKAALEKIQRVQTEERDNLKERQRQKRDELIRREAAKMKDMAPRIESEKGVERERCRFVLEETKERHIVEKGWWGWVIRKRTEMVVTVREGLIENGSQIESFLQDGRKDLDVGGPKPRTEAMEMEGGVVRVEVE